MQKRLLVRVHAEDVPLGRSGGIEGFVRGLVQGMSASNAVDLEVWVPRGTEGLWRAYLAVPVAVREPQGASAERFKGASMVKRVLRRFPLAWELRSRMRRGQLSSPVQNIAVDYFPFHRGRVYGETIGVTVHDMRAFDPEFGDPVSARNLARNLREAQVVFVSWEHPAQQLIDRFPEVESKLVKVPFPLMNASETVQPAPVSILAGKRFLLYPAAMVPHKNHQVLLELFDQGSLVPDDLHLVLTGQDDTDIGESIRARVRRAELDNRVHMLGFVTEEELAWLYNECWALVMPSMYEAASGPVMEAMLHARPVLVADLPVFRAQLGECGGGAALFDPRSVESLAEAMREVERHYKELAGQAARGGEWYRKLSWDAAGALYLRAFTNYA